MRLSEVRHPSLSWKIEGHSFINQMIARTYHGEVVYGRITKWLPADEAKQMPAIYHMRHDDGWHAEDLLEDEVKQARRLFLASESQTALQNGASAPPCSEEGGAPREAGVVCVTNGDPPHNASPPARADSGIAIIELSSDEENEVRSTLDSSTSSSHLNEHAGDYGEINEMAIKRQRC